MPEEPTPPAKNRLGWLSVPVLLAVLIFGLATGVALFFVAQQFWSSIAISSVLAIFAIGAGAALACGAMVALFAVVRKILGRGSGKALASAAGFLGLLWQKRGDYRQWPSLFQEKETQDLWAEAKPFIRGFFLTSAAGLGLAIAHSTFTFAQFLVTHVQTRRLEEQNRLLVAQNEVTAAQQSFEQARALAESRFQDVQRILADIDSPLPLQVAALRQAPEVAAMTVPKIALEKQADREGQPTDQRINSTLTYPNAPRIRTLLLSYMKMERAEHLLTKAQPSGAKESLDQKAMLKALEPLRPVSTELLFTLHRMGPTAAPVPVSDSDQKSNYPKSAKEAHNQTNQPQISLWSIPESGKANGTNGTAAAGPREHPEIAGRESEGRKLDVAVDLRHIDPSDFASLQLSQGNFEVEFRLHLPDTTLLHSAQIQGAGLERAQMQGANLREAQMQGSNLTGAAMQDADISLAYIQGADLSHAQLRGANFNSARLQKANFGLAQLQNADFSLAEMQGAVLSDAQLQGADLSEAKMHGTVMAKAKMQGTVLIKAEMQGANLKGTDMQAASLSQAQMQGADLKGAEMQGAVLLLAQLEGVVLAMANMQGAILNQTKLQGACLIGARIQGADFRSVEAGGIRLIARREGLVGNEVVLLDEQRGVELLLPGMLITDSEVGNWETVNVTGGHALLERAEQLSSSGKKLSEGFMNLLTTLEPLRPSAAASWEHSWIIGTYGTQMIKGDTLTRYPFPIEYEADLKAILGPDKVKRVTKKTRVAGMRLWSEDGPAYMDVATRDQFRALAKEEREAALAEAKNAKDEEARNKAEETARAAELTLSDLKKVITDPAELAERRKWNLLEAVKEAEVKAVKAK